MSYTKQTWNTGDTITAEKLNHMEDGIASSGGGYDFVLSNGISGITAEGISFDEMTQKGPFALKACLVGLDGTVYEATGRTVVEGEEVVLGFSDSNNTLLAMSPNGTGNLGSASLTYTYSDGHYTFTVGGGGST